MTWHRAAVPTAIAVALALAAAVSAAPARKAAPGPKPALADTAPAVALGMAPLNEVPGFWYTRAERTKYVQTSTYDETVAYLRRLEAATTWFSVQSYGRSGQGRDMVFVVASKDRAFTPAAARATGKPVVLVECGIHSGEIEGKDAMLALLRDIAVGGRQRALLDRCVLLVVPMFSPDAHERRSRY